MSIWQKSLISRKLACPVLYHTNNILCVQITTCFDSTSLQLWHLGNNIATSMSESDIELGSQVCLWMRQHDSTQPLFSHLPQKQHLPLNYTPPQLEEPHTSQSLTNVSTVTLRSLFRLSVQANKLIKLVRGSVSTAKRQLILLQTEFGLDLLWHQLLLSGNWFSTGASASSTLPVEVGFLGPLLVLFQ